MSLINELIVRDFFELLGYQVSQPCKYFVGGRPKRAQEAADLLIVHPGISRFELPDRILWDVSSLQGVSHAAVGICGWHAERIYEATLENLLEISRFTTPAAIRAAQTHLNCPQLATILCLPRLPASPEHQKRVMEQLRARGINGVLCFDVILRALIARVDINHNYGRSEALQMLRILKSYGLLQSGQLELFSSARARRRQRKGPPIGSA